MKLVTFELDARELGNDGSVAVAFHVRCAGMSEVQALLASLSGGSLKAEDAKPSVPMPERRTVPASEPAKPATRGRASKQQELPATRVSEKVVPPRDEIVDEVEEARRELGPNGAGDAVELPKELLAATSFRQVISWMLENGHKDKKEILALCEAWRDKVPAIAKLAGDLGDRIARGLELMSVEKRP